MGWVCVLMALTLAWGIYWSLPHKNSLRERIAKLEVKVEKLEEKK